MTAPTTSAQPTWREWTGLALLALPMFMMLTDFTVMFMVTPSVAADLGPSTTQMLWIVHVGEFVAAGLVITMGWLVGRLGHKQMLLASMALYGLASALAAFAANPETLLVARVLIGAAAAAASPAAIAMLRTMFTSANHYGIAFAVIMGAFSAGVAFGPPMGGVLLEYFWWGAVFLVNVPVAAVVLLAGFWVFPRASERTEEKIDITSVVLSLAAVIAVVFGLQEIADQGASAPYVFAVAVGIALGVMFVRRQRRVTNPLLDLNLFSVRPLRVAAIAFMLSSMAFVAVDFILVQYLQIVTGIPTAQLGLMLAIPGIAAVLGTLVTPMLARRLAASSVIAIGLVVSLAGAGLVMATIAFAPSMVALFIASTTMVAFGVSPLRLIGAQLIVTSAPKKQAGSAVAVQDISAGFGGAMGMAFIGSLAMAVFSRVLGSDAPAGVSRNSLDAASQSPGGGVAVAENIGGSAGQQLLVSVQGAWSMGTLAAYTAALALGLVTLVLIWRGLRGVELPTDDQDGANPATPEPEPGLSTTGAKPQLPTSPRNDAREEDPS
ncbi:MFS transporter [Nesterenkonia sp. CL21]|uniref:MFS transporter n=1 Tax=Nesterenkonia sp. CL21 TaxID=3064894 RepID=UPI0028785543|nr:MFS transporter [Nesterenkonia sp. CL21]MDS2172387.1 MFS transporter [Nesterenkonia sp. CL21]